MGGEGGRTHVVDVLVVDDEPAIRLLCTVNLELEGHAVREAGTVADAFAALAERTPDVVLLDLHVAGDDGIAVLELVEERRLPTRVILLSGTAEVGPELRARVDGVLGKPFELERLSEAVAGGGSR